LEVRLKRTLQSYSLLGGIAGTIILIDQVSKALVRQYLPIGSMWAPWDWLMPYARFFHVQNSGVAFGMFQGTGWFFAILAVLVSGAIIYYYPQISSEDWVMRVALGMQLGGALGNLIDRLLFHWQVTDFISVGTFAIFNVADSGVTVGVCVLLLGVWLQERREKKNPLPLETPPQEFASEPGSTEEVKE
jgi:signal peptidase II